MTDLRQKIYLATISEAAPALAREHRLGLEIDEFCTATNMDADFPRWDARVREALASTDRAVLHAPFAELTPCAVDPLIREVSMRRLTQAGKLCARYGIRRMVVHSGFLPRVYFPVWFVEQGAGFFRELLSKLPKDFELLIENVLDPEPEPLVDLAQAIADPRARLCLDVGHAHAVSQIPVSRWLNVCAPVLGHLHLHDNDGSADLHRVPGDGTIGFPGLFDQILTCAPSATFTFESPDAIACVDRLMQYGLL